MAKKKGEPDPGRKRSSRRRWFRSFFKGAGVLITVRSGTSGRKVTISGAVARSVRPRLRGFMESLPLQDASIRFALDEKRGWRIERADGVPPGVEQQIRNFLTNEA